MLLIMGVNKGYVDLCIFSFETNKLFFVPHPLLIADMLVVILSPYYCIFNASILHLKSESKQNDRS